MVSGRLSEFKQINTVPQSPVKDKLMPHSLKALTERCSWDDKKSSGSTSCHQCVPIDKASMVLSYRPNSVDVPSTKERELDIGDQKLN